MAPATASELSKLHGGLLLGFLFGAAAGGAFWSQVVVYFGRFSKDRLRHKVVISCLTAVSLLSFSVSATYAWHVFIAIALNPSLADRSAPVYYDLTTVCPWLGAALSQAFFGTRAWALGGRKRSVAAVLLFLWAAHLAFGLTTVIIFGRPNRKTNATLPQSDRRLGVALLALGAGIDVFISTLLVFTLRRARQGYNPRTDSLLMRCARMTVVTGGVTAVLTTATAVDVLRALLRDSSDTEFSTATVSVLPHVAGLVCVATLNLRVKHQSSSYASRTGTGDWSGSPGPRKPAEGVERLQIGARDLEASATASVPVAPSYKYTGSKPALPPLAHFDLQDFARQRTNESDATPSPWPLLPLTSPGSARRDEDPT